MTRLEGSNPSLSVARLSRLTAARPLGAGATAALIALLGFGVSLAGDACHVASGTTEYEWSGVPSIWRSAIWFPFLVAGGVLGAAWLPDGGASGSS